MKTKFIYLAILAFLVLTALIMLFSFHARSPVLIVTEESFIGLYGQKRIQDEAFRASLSLFRPVRTVIVANDAGDDITALAVREISDQPFCVLFPSRFIRAARFYREQNPQIPVVILENRSQNTFVGSDNPDFFTYKTDIENDFYRAGVVAAAIASVTTPAGSQNRAESALTDLAADNEQNRRIVVFAEPNIMPQAREAFLLAINDLEKPPETRFFTSFSQFSDSPDIKCVVIAGTGFEFLDRKSGVPVIYFTWLDPFLVPADVVVIVNDSPWAQVVRAVRMINAGEDSGIIPSKFYVLDRKKFDRGTLRKITKI